VEKPPHTIVVGRSNIVVPGFQDLCCGTMVQLGMIFGQLLEIHGDAVLTKLEKELYSLLNLRALKRKLDLRERELTIALIPP
jgi:hypothetical protein